MSTQQDRTPNSRPEHPGQPGRRIWLALLLFVVGAALGGSGVWWSMSHRGLPSGPTAAQQAPLYQCPMHPTITSDHPGDCPICGMKLVEVSEPTSPSVPAPAPGERRIAFYRSPMDPQQTSPTPRKDEMGMDYVPVHEDELQGASEPPAKGLATVSIDPGRQQLIGLRTVSVTQGLVAGTWRTVGRVQIDPTRVRRTNTKVEGYVERLYVDFVGRPVRQGEPLYSLYSPSLLAAEGEYVLALQTREALAQAGAATASGDTLVASARRKLELWDVPAEELDRLEHTRQPAKTLTVLSPISGVVTAKNVVEGTRLNPGDSPYEITDLAVVWVMADAYETDLAQVRLGMPASLVLPAYPNRTFTGTVAFVDPLLDPRTRTTKVHLHFANPSRELMPEMFGEVRLEGAGRQGLRIPADAVVRSGTTDVVFLSLGDGRFEPREVHLGAGNDDLVEVVSGLEVGQEVVTRATFLVDSESQLRASLAAIGGK